MYYCYEWWARVSLQELNLGISENQRLKIDHCLPIGLQGKEGSPKVEVTCYKRCLVAKGFGQRKG